MSKNTPRKHEVKPPKSDREGGKEKADEDAEEDLCNICFSEQANAVFLDCGHGQICLSCAVDSMQKSTKCLFCREPVVQIIQIHQNAVKSGLFKVINSYFVSATSGKVV